MTLLTPVYTHFGTRRLYRFAEMAQIYAKTGCQLLVYPGAFNMTTGPAHWELLQRCRAIDNQVVGPEQMKSCVT